MAMESFGTKILMDEGDWGLALPFKISGDGLLPTDTIKIAIKSNIYENNVIIEKEFTNFNKIDGKFGFELTFTEEETKLLPPGNYVYGIKQYRDGNFLNTVINEASFEVREGV